MLKKKLILEINYDTKAEGNLYIESSKYKKFEWYFFNFHQKDRTNKYKLPKMHHISIHSSYIIPNKGMFPHRKIHYHFQVIPNTKTLLHKFLSIPNDIKGSVVAKFFQRSKKGGIYFTIQQKATSQYIKNLDDNLQKEIDKVSAKIAQYYSDQNISMHTLKNAVARNREKIWTHSINSQFALLVSDKVIDDYDEILTCFSGNIEEYVVVGNYVLEKNRGGEVIVGISKQK